MRAIAFYRGVVLAAVATALALVTPASADRVLFDFEPAYLYEPGFTVKDHDLVFDGALWHSFYIRGIEGVPGTGSEVQLGHATSQDLRNWIIMPPVIDAGPEPWDTSRVWAPDLRPDAGGWSMYYTGVDGDFLQRMGGATSPDLSDWTKLVENPVVEPDSTVYLWSPHLDVPELSAFRDPFQFDYLGERHLLHTALVPDSTLTAGRRGVIHHLVDDGAGSWTDVGPLAVNNSSSNGAWRELESVQLIEEGSRWHLFFTFFGLGGVHWVAADSPSAEWDISSAVMIDPGVGAEITSTGSGSWLITRYGSGAHAATHPEPGQTFYTLRVDTLRFSPGPDPPVVVPESSFHERWPEQQGISFLAAPIFGDNAVERGLLPMNQIGNGYLSSIDFYDGPFGQYGAPGTNVGSSATGMISSEWFSIAPDDSMITMLVAGPEDPECAVRLVERISEMGEPLVTAELDSAMGNDSASFSLRAWDVRAWRNRTVRLEVTDLSPTGWIALDHVRMFTSNPVQTAAPPAQAPLPARLLPNRPNPFNPRTEIRFDLEFPAVCELEVFDARGRLVRHIDAGTRSAGRHAVVLDASGLASGTYFVQLIADGIATAQRKISLIR